MHLPNIEGFEGEGRNGQTAAFGHQTWKMLTRPAEQPSGIFGHAQPCARTRIRFVCGAKNV